MSFQWYNTIHHQRRQPALSSIYSFDTQSYGLDSILAECLVLSNEYANNIGVSSIYILSNVELMSHGAFLNLVFVVGVVVCMLFENLLFLFPLLILIFVLVYPTSHTYFYHSSLYNRCCLTQQ